MQRFQQRPKGYHINLLNQYLSIKIKKKEQATQKKGRFDFGRKSGNESFNLDSSRDKSINLLNAAELDNIDIEMVSTQSNSQNIKELPPIWVDQYEQIQDLLKEVDKIFTKIKTINKQRVKQQFSLQESNLDSQANIYTEECTKLLKKCDKLIHQGFNQNQIQQDNEKDKINYQREQKILKNVKQKLAQQTQEIALELRQEQKVVYNTLKKFSDSQDSKFKPQSFQEFSLNLDEDEEKNKQKQEGFLDYDIAQERDSEINKLVDQINELAQLFQQLNDIVIEQGTIVDRIDVNIEQSQKQIKQSVVTLKKAKEHQQTSMCVKRVTFCLVFFIVVLAIILAFKYSSKD